MELETFEDVLKSIRLNSRRKYHLLMGNGFSMAYDPKIFSYNALYDFFTTLEDDLLSKLFDIVKTKNFELIMQHLETFEALLDAFGADSVLKGKVVKANKKLKKSLLCAIKELHPEHVFRVTAEQSDCCGKFIKYFLDTNGQIYTTNYDLLLYWVLMRNNVIKSVDGFGRDRENPDGYVPEEELEYSELRWGKYQGDQNIFYLHGALPLFDTGIEIVKEEYDGSNYLLENIGSRIDKGEYPIFVTAGNGKEKLAHIRHNRYLSNCYDCLSNIDGSLVTFGFNFGPYDDHIIDAINVAALHGRKASSKLWSIYIGVFSDEDRKHIEKISSRFKCKVHMYDVKTANIWS